MRGQESRRKEKELAKKFFKDETGKRYGRLVVEREYKRTREGIYWLCKCDCGNEVAALGQRLRNGLTRSCGCLRAMPFEERVKLGYWPSGTEREKKQKVTTLREALVEDLAHAEEACERTATRTDIWQDRIVYWMAVAIVHIITWILRKEKQS
jgi:hypothetical protein